MGYFAGSLGGNDTSPGASFEVPPTSTAPGSITGTITDSATDDPIEGATVSVAFQGSPFVINPTTTTAADGTYSIGPIPQGTYPKVTIQSDGYDVEEGPLTVDQAVVTNDVGLNRDWASSAGGGSISDFTGPDFTPFDCGPVNAIDQSDGFGWSTTADLDSGVAGPDTPKYMVIQLPTFVDISSITINPTAICGDGLSASTGDFKVETSVDGVNFAQVAAGQFVAADRGHANAVTLTGPLTGVQYVKFWINAPMVLTDTATYGADACNSGGAFSGCTYEDATEVSVYGSASP